MEQTDMVVARMAEVVQACTLPSRSGVDTPQIYACSMIAGSSSHSVWVTLKSKKRTPESDSIKSDFFISTALVIGAVYGC